MNRQQRRAHGHHKLKARIRTSRDLLDPTNPAQCPDCDAEIVVIATTTTAQGGAVHEVEVRHDDSCPWYADLKRDLR